MPKSSKRRAAPAAVKPTTKRPRADVHPIQEALAGRVPDEPGIIVAPMGSGKPRMAGKFLDRIVPEHVAACGDEHTDTLISPVVPCEHLPGARAGVLAIV